MELQIHRDEDHHGLAHGLHLDKAAGRGEVVLATVAAADHLGAAEQEYDSEHSFVEAEKNAEMVAVEAHTVAAAAVAAAADTLEERSLDDSSEQTREQEQELELLVAADDGDAAAADHATAAVGDSHLEDLE